MFTNFILFSDFRPAIVLASLTALLFTAAHPAQSQVLYSNDDGKAEGALGVLTGGTLTFANQFTIVAGGEKVTSISIAWGAPRIRDVANGTPFTAKLWSDPNNDGLPGDSILLSSVSGVTGLAGTNTFITYDIPDVTFLPGQKFFVGATITNGFAQFPAAIDLNTPISNHSFISLGNSLSSGAFDVGSVFGGDFLVRANAVSSVPESGSVAMLIGAGIAGGMFAVRLRKRR